MLVRSRLGLALPVVLSFVSCSSDRQESSARIDFGFIVPQALLDQVDSMKLYVAEASDQLLCDEPSGETSADIVSAAGVQSFDLRRGTQAVPCPEGAVYCSEEITLPTDANRTLVFQAVGYRQGTTYAVGCSTAAVNSNPFYLHLVVHRHIPKAVCGNGTLEPGEQCEGAGGPPAADDPMCDTQCRSRELLLSNDNKSGSQQILNAPPLSKSQVELAWTPGGPLHAVFQDTNGNEVNYRQLLPDMGQVTSPAVLAGQIRLPCNGCGSVPGFDQRASIQKAPAIGIIQGGSFVVAYEDSRKSSPGENNVSLTLVSSDAKTPSADEVYFDTTTGVKHPSSPSVAGGPPGTALVVWTDSDSGALRGRVYNNSAGWLASPITFADSGCSQARVVGWNAGWTVVWKGFSTDPDDIVMADVTATGNTSNRKLVNDKAAGVQSQPAIALTPSGEMIVVWRDGGAIYMQRYDKYGTRIEGDQSAPVNTDGVGDNAAVAGSSLNEGFYAIAWQANGKIMGRFVDVAGGYLYNSVDGQDGPFEVGIDATQGPRTLPSVAVGGDGYVAFAWQDESQNHPGIYARRFPLPAR